MLYYYCVWFFSHVSWGFFEKKIFFLFFLDFQKVNSFHRVKSLFSNKFVFQPLQKICFCFKFVFPKWIFRFHFGWNWNFLIFVNFFKKKLFFRPKQSHVLFKKVLNTWILLDFYFVMYCRLFRLCFVFLQLCFRVAKQQNSKFPSKIFFVFSSLKKKNNNKKQNF